MLNKVYELIDRVWGLISEAVFLRFEFDLPVEKIARFQNDGRATFVLTHGGMVEWLILSSWSRRNGFGAILIANRKRILLFSRPLFFFQILFRRRTYADLFLDERESGPRLLFCPKSERKQPFVPTRLERLFADILKAVGHGPRANWLTLLPILIVWRKHARGEGRQLIEYLWGLSSSPNLIGQMWYLARRRRDSTVRYLGSLSLNQKDPEAALSPNDEAPLVAAKALRRKILVTVNQEMRVLLGPRFLSPLSMKETIAQHPEIMALVQKIASEDKVSLRTVERRVYKNLTEISANYTFRAIEVLYVLLTWLFNKVFEGVVINDSEFQRLRETGKTKPVVYIPCHRSHLDYLVLPYSLFVHDMVTPHIAAGINLAFWPVGYFLRVGGAFFIRRSFRNDPLYSICLKKYVEHLLKSRYTLMFFIEGTRSRSGKMMAPQFGMLKMVMEACQKNLVEDIVLAPVAICYDEIPEQGAYSKELAGAEKKKESAGALISSRSIIKRKFGRVYVRVAEPLSARAALDNTPGDDLLGLQKTAFQICKKITDVTPITPKALVSSVLLCHHTLELSLEDILRCVNQLAEFAQKHNRPLVVTEGVSLRHSVEQIIRQIQSQNIAMVNSGVPRTFSCEVSKRAILNFYKNNSIHIFVTLSLSILTFLHIMEESGDDKKIYRDQWLDKILNLRNLLKFDFFFEPTPVFTLEVETLWKEFWGYDGAESASLTDLKLHFIQRFQKLGDMSVYYRVLGEILEGYLTTLQFVMSSKPMKIEKRTLLQRVIKYADVRELQGSLVFTESRSSQNYANAISLMENLKLLSIGEKSMVELRPQEEGLREIEKDFSLYLELLQKSPEYYFKPTDPLTVR